MSSQLTRSSRTATGGLTGTWSELFSRDVALVRIIALIASLPICGLIAALQPAGSGGILAALTAAAALGASIAPDSAAPTAYVVFAGVSLGVATGSRGAGTLLAIAVAGAALLAISHLLFGLAGVLPRRASVDPAVGRAIARRAGLLIAASGGVDIVIFAAIGLGPSGWGWRAAGVAAAALLCLGPLTLLSGATQRAS